jgi:hypothetical protein
MLRGTWSDPNELGEVLATYAARWIRERPGLSERTARFYEGLLRLHVEPVLGRKDIRRLTPPMVRPWRQGLMDGGVGASTVAKAYRFLRALDGAGLAGIHIHDLRHAGNHFAAMTGASTRELMGRMGYASMDAALIYQHPRPTVIAPSRMRSTSC